MTTYSGAETGRRIAIVHFTAPPAIGGVESLMARQFDVLQGLGHGVVYVTGTGTAPNDVESIRIPAMNPGSEAIKRGHGALGRLLPMPDHSLVELLVDRLGRALRKCTDCWVHNALTVTLNPFLTVALQVLIQRRPEIAWVAWCEDLSSSSRFIPAPVKAAIFSVAAISNKVTWVTISQVRRQELASALGIPAKEILVVNPPIDLPTWLDLGTQARTVLTDTHLFESDSIVFVPAKALPHKCLERAVGVGAALVRSSYDVRILITASTSPHQPNLSARVLQELRSAIRVAGVESTVHLLSDLLGADPTDRTVRELMQMSDVVLLPSLEEGFGMPLLEAAACRVPVVCTDVPVFREVGGDSALYFGENWEDERVASLILAAARRNGNTQRRRAVNSMQRFRADLQAILNFAAHPKV